MIFCVEDERPIRELIVYTLQNTGFSAEGFENGEDMLRAAQKKPPELVLLDIMLPRTDGIEILKAMKRNPALKNVPVILVTAKGTEYDKVTGLDGGADDYITKPFGMMELVSRIRAVLRRTGEAGRGELLVHGSVTLDARRHIITVDGQEVSLTYKEFELLRLLMENQGAVLTRDILLEKIWGYDFDGETRTVDVHIRTLRKKLGPRGDIVETVRGVGYRVGR